MRTWICKELCSIDGEPPQTTTSQLHPWHRRGARSEAFPQPPKFTRDWEPEVSSRPEHLNVSFVHVVHIMIDQEHTILYRNHIELFKSTLTTPTRIYPFKNLIKLYHDGNGNTLSLEDDFANKYRTVHQEELDTYSCWGVPILFHAKVATTAYFGEIPIPRETQFDHVYPPIAPIYTEPIEQTFGRVHLDQEQTPIPRAEPVGSIAPSNPPRVERNRGKREEATKALHASKVLSQILMELGIHMTTLHDIDNFCS